MTTALGLCFPTSESLVNPIDRQKLAIHAKHITILPRDIEILRDLIDTMDPEINPLGHRPHTADAEEKHRKAAAKKEIGH